MKNSEEIYFYIKDFKTLINEDLDISFIPMMIRRKLSVVDKFAIATLSHFNKYNVDELVFSSQFGEIERLLKLIEQYLTENEVSPNVFSSSVHNFLIGLYSQINCINTSYTALSAENKSLSMGLLKSILTNKENVLFCYSDKHDKDAKALSCLISKVSGKIKCKLQKTNNTENLDEFSKFVDFLNGAVDKLDFGCYSIERVEQ